ncbi:MAG: hypothetical protein ABI855_11635 [Bacteroidota bacterium]
MPNGSSGSSNWSTRSKFSKPVNMPDVGSFVKKEIYDLEISVPALAKRLSISADRAYRLLRRKDWRVSEIMNISMVIDFNLFDWYARETQPAKEVTPTEDAAAQKTLDDLQSLKHRNALLENENRLLREMVDVLKSK